LRVATVAESAALVLLS